MGKFIISFAGHMDMYNDYLYCNGSFFVLQKNNVHKIYFTNCEKILKMVLTKNSICSKLKTHRRCEHKKCISQICNITNNVLDKYYKGAI